jgi:hypothetical protein
VNPELNPPSRMRVADVQRDPFAVGRIERLKFGGGGRRQRFDLAARHVNDRDICTTCVRLRGRPEFARNLPEEEWVVERDC